MTAESLALNALAASAVGQRACAQCGTHFKAKRSWARFCSTDCRNLFHAAELKRQHIREYLSELGRKGAAARKARRAAS